MSESNKLFQTNSSVETIFLTTPNELIELNESNESNESNKQIISTYLVFNEFNDKINKIVEQNSNQIEVNLNVCDNIKSLYTKQEEQKIQIDILSKLLNHTSDDLVSTINKVNSTEIRVTNTDNLMMDMIGKMNMKLQEQSQHLNTKDQQIVELFDAINKLNQKINKIEQTQQTQQTKSNCICECDNLKNRQFGSVNKSPILNQTVTKSSCFEESKSLLKRLERANSQNINVELMFIGEKSISCQILGTSKDIYIVSLVGEPTCTCADYENHKNKCKHILYVLHKILKIDINKKSFEYDELILAIQSQKLHKIINIISGK